MFKMFFVCFVFFALGLNQVSSCVASDSTDENAVDDSSERQLDDRMPAFRWDTLPLYMHIRKVDAFTAEELDFLAGFPLITLEKTTGARTYGSTDEGTIQAAKAIKQVNPAAKVLFYRNVIVHYGGYSFDQQLDDIPNWYLIDKRGKEQLIRNECQAYDTSNSALRKWWVTTATDVCKSPYVDGVFLDGNVKVLSSYLKRQLPPNKKQQTIDGYRDMMTETRQVLGPKKLMIANMIRARFDEGGVEFMNYFDGSYLECFVTPAGTQLNQADYLAKGIAATQKSARQGKIIAMTMSIGDSSVSDGVDELHKRVDDISKIQQDELNFKLALFLVCAEKYSYLFLNDGYCADVRGKNRVCQSGLWLKSLPEYKKNLGAPKGPAKQQGYVYTREFQHASVWLDVEKNQGKIDWK